MAELKVKVNDALLDELKAVWQFNKRHVRPDILKRMGWHEWENFLGDVLAHGYQQASNSPLEFMKQVRDHKDPIFLDPRKRAARAAKVGGKQGATLQRFEHEFERAYS
jgi:hypothetical protein